MFDTILLEVPRGERRRRKLTLLATVAGEALVIAVLVAVPLFYLDALPNVSALAPTITVPLGPAPDSAPQQNPHPGGGTHGTVLPGQAPTVRYTGTSLLT